MQDLISGARRIGIELTPGQTSRFGLYSRELLSWNARVNLTAIVEPLEIERRHFLDSLTVLLAFGSEGLSSMDVVDVGTGAGFPGIPLKIVFPEMRLTLLEATAKKVRFLRFLTDALAMPDVEVIAARAEELAHDARHREAYDAVLARALAPLPVLAELTLPFCRVGGLVVAQKKGEIEPEMQEAAGATRTLGGAVEATVPVCLPELGPDDRKLVLLRKVAATPPTYPRRPGMPAKRPLPGSA